MDHLALTLEPGMRREGILMDADHKINVKVSAAQHQAKSETLMQAPGIEPVPRGRTLYDDS